MISGELFVGPFGTVFHPDVPQWVRLDGNSGFHVRPGLVHRFWSPRGCCVREISWGGPESDIVRYSTSGVSSGAPPLKL